MKTAALTLMAALLAACVPQSPATATATAEATMSDWMLDQIDGKAPGWSASLDLSEPGKISGKAPCNGYFAGVSITGATLAIKPIAATRMACADLAGETVYFQLLQAMTGIEQGADRLVLTGGGHEMVFRRGE